MHRQALHRYYAATALETQRGMSLIEIMIVLAIIGMILGGVGVVAFRRFSTSQLSTAKNTAIEIQNAVDMYRVSHGSKCPKSVKELKAAGEIARAVKDPWGQDYVIDCGDSVMVKVSSAGPDKEMGTDDDISNLDDSESEQGEG